MTRSPHQYDPPPHLASVFHRHPCPNCGVWYACMNPAHEPGSPRPCGSSAGVCKPTTKENDR